jgi:hypothetical protein
MGPEDRSATFWRYDRRPGEVRQAVSREIGSRHAHEPQRIEAPDRSERFYLSDLWLDRVRSDQEGQCPCDYGRHAEVEQGQRPAQEPLEIGEPY